MKLIIGSYHKTGTLLLFNIFKEITGNTKVKLEREDGIFECNDFKFYHHFNDVPNDEIINNKCIVIVRNPYEIICSGVRYHSNIEFAKDEDWLHVKKNNKSYFEEISSLENINDKISFEMKNCSYNTISSIYNDLKYRNYNNNIYIIKIEDFENINLIKKITTNIYNMFNGRFSEKHIFDSIIKIKNRNFHRTIIDKVKNYKSYFNDDNYEEFNDLFPKDILFIMNYCNINIKKLNLEFIDKLKKKLEKNESESFYHEAIEYVNLLIG